MCSLQCKQITAARLLVPWQYQQYHLHHLQVTSVYHMKSSKLKSRLDEVKLLQSGFEGCTVHHIDRYYYSCGDTSLFRLHHLQWFHFGYR